MTKKGFTLMELLAVMLIISILSGIAIPQYRKVVEKSRFTKAQVMAKSMYDSCERMMAEFGVEDYASLLAAIKARDSSFTNVLPRMDIGSEDLLPVGFTITAADEKISGGGFTYALRKSGECFVNIAKTKGSYSGVTLTYDGTQFTCSDNDSGACEIYGLE